MVNKYLGVKIICAQPMTHGEYTKIKYGEDRIPTEFSEKNKDKKGYFLKYSEKPSDENAYISWSPVEAFEEAYREISNLTFGLAIEALKKGKTVTRKGWNGKGMWIELQTPDAHSKMTKPYIFLVAPKGSNNYYCDDANEFNRVPWLPSITDILAEDWCIIE